MLLAIDIGNTNTVLGLFTGQALACQWRLRSDSTTTGDELAASLKGLFSLAGHDFTGVSGVCIASVVPQLQSTWAAMSSRYFGISPLLVSHQLAHSMVIRTDNPAEVGADRIVNAVAAFARYQCALIIVDLGTAITFDCVSPQGEFLGGAIAPGLGLAREALANRTAKLPRVNLASPPAQAIGTSTVGAITSGLLFGYGGLVEELIRRLSAEMAPPVPTIIATGGLAGTIAPFAPSLTTILPDLTLEGLRLLHERNR